MMHRNGGMKTESRPILSAAVIAQNEERQIGGLVDSLIDWVDEVVVVDGGSGDRTVEIARSRGARVYHRPFDTFARQRMAAVERCRGRWILSIDADERPTPRLVEQITRAIGDDRAAAYRIPIRSRIFGRPMRFTGTQDDRPIRLFRRDAARWTGSVHEMLEVRGRVARLDGWLTHETQQDLQTFLTKMHRYTRLEAERRVAEGRPPRLRDWWLAPPREIFRRLVYKMGFLDGPAGWAFSVLSGLYEWVLAREHLRQWNRLQSVEEMSDCGLSPVDAASVYRPIYARISIDPGAGLSKRRQREPLFDQPTSDGPVAIPTAAAGGEHR